MASEKNRPAVIQTNTAIQDSNEIQNKIYTIRNQQVMLDSDLALMYQVETKRLNERVKRNIARFPENFCFQLTKDEYDNLRTQIATSSEEYGGRRYLPYVFTEQGIAMLSAVLNSETAINVSIKIMNAFVEMRRFMASNAMLFERISAVELKQIEFQKKTEEKFDEVFEYISDHAESEQKIFYDGQIYDAFSLIASIIQKATKSIDLVDGYVDVVTLNLLAKKKKGVGVKVYTFPKTNLSQTDVKNFNAQYPKLEVKMTNAFHDRFMVLDDKTVYHIGASIKDAGKKCFGITLIQDDTMANDLISRLKKIK
ncbi:ORF6N domain-containing protein [[Clostridium] aminophilum]|uniref:ORF6N domain-containing protein n=1 Tax=[Clostridium] aminophilum TaxID=1526 RepID=A0A1I0C8Z3_9FIRM|nr:ORF6N domain-containing protein [[Clostridium] aminophilum]SET15861.1 ORF6N domain-containing protein [[Clostridium] aminophilum]